MTIQSIIDVVDELKPNQYSSSQKIAWISTLDHMVFLEVIATHEHDEVSFTPYAAMTDDLLIPTPYGEEIYRHYLESQIDLYNQEMAKYNNSAALFNNALLNWKRYYNRTVLPLQPNKTSIAPSTYSTEELIEYLNDPLNQR